MKTPKNNPKRAWTVSETKSRLSEIMRLAEQEGSQHIGVRRSFVIIPADEWHSMVKPLQSAGKWLAYKYASRRWSKRSIRQKIQSEFSFHEGRRE